MILIAHLSDLHAANPPGQDREVRVIKALADAESMTDGQLDLLVFSGDLVHDGKKEEYEAAHSLMIEPAMTRFALSPEQVIPAAGNHEVDLEEMRRLGRPELRAELTNRAAIEDHQGDPDRLFRATAGLRQWEAYLRRLWGPGQPLRPGPLAFVRRFSIDQTSVGVAVLNSGWLSQGSGDRGHLILGNLQVEPVLQAIAEDDVRIVVIHHPLDWIAPFDAEEVRSALARVGVILLNGHLHTANVTAEQSAKGEILTVRAGCLYDSERGYPTCYSLIEIDPATHTVEVLYRRWYEPRKTFDADLWAAPGGRETFPLPLSRETRELGHPPFCEVVGNIARDAEGLRIKPRRAAGEVKSIRDVLIDPRFLEAPDQGVGL